MLTTRDKILQDIFMNYDFGYDVDVIGSKPWEKNQDDYKKMVFLEFINSSYSKSHEAVLEVLFKTNSDEVEKVQAVLVSKDIQIGASNFKKNI